MYKTWKWNRVESRKYSINITCKVIMEISNSIEKWAKDVWNKYVPSKMVIFAG